MKHFWIPQCQLDKINKLQFLETENSLAKIFSQVLGSVCAKTISRKELNEAYSLIALSYLTRSETNIGHVHIKCTDTPLCITSNHSFNTFLSWLKFFHKTSGFRQSRGYASCTTRNSQRTIRPLCSATEHY